MEFKKFKLQFQENFKKVLAESDALFLTDVTRETLWETYLNSFPEQHRQHHNCNACKQFLRPYANIVAIKDNKLVSMWNFTCEEPFQTVVNKLHELVISAPVRDVFFSKFAKIGTDFNHERTENGILTWEHFYLVLPSKFVNKSSDSEEAIMGQYRDSKNVFKRSLDEISLDAIETTLELIQQNSLYRGEESKASIELFLKYKKEYASLPENEKDNYCWLNSIQAGSIARIRNNAIGTLLIDISEGKDLDHAVTAFEKIMCPINYKRPNAIITKKMIEEAHKKIQELGFEESLGRRYAVIDDITVNNVIYANRDAKKAMNVFEEMIQEAAINPKTFSKIEEVPVEQFIENILPNATAIELLMEERLANNLMSLIAPVIPDAPTMFKWHNNFCWSYNNDVTDSIKERVTAAGGQVNGELRVSLSWYNYDDLDIHVVEPDNTHIYYANKQSVSGGNLDVDMNAGSGKTRKGVENTIWPTNQKMKEGKYRVYVYNYCKRESVDVGFVVEIEHAGEIFTFSHKLPVGNNQTVEVAQFMYSKTNGIKFLTAIDSKNVSKEIWNVNTNQFQQVSVLMYSPNHWDEKAIGNKHYFFIMQGCKNSNNTRGFYNEFLKEELMKHKRVFEALGSKMKVAHSDTQLSGLGFSSTSRNSVICNVQGAFKRTIKIIF
jgi:hypothetical protein